MEEMSYNILWMDDEHETLTGIKGRAKRNGINLIPFKSRNGGLSELQRNSSYYDGVLLDAKFFENEDDEAGSEDTTNVHRAKEVLLGLNKKFEIFILTGQAEAFEDKTFNKAFTKVFKKGSDAEVNRLFEEIKVAAAKQPDTQMRQKNNRVFDVCTEHYIGELAGQDLLALLKVVGESNMDENFNTLRKIVEDLFCAFNKFNLLPSEFVKPSVAINESSKFLSGKDIKGTFFEEKGYKHLDGTHLPSQISYYIRTILYITQAGSHRSETDTYVKTVKTSYLFQSILYQLMDVLVWFKMYVDSKPTIENWEYVAPLTVPATVVASEPTEILTGKVIQINLEKGFAFFKPDSEGDNIYIPAHLVTNLSLTIDMIVDVEIEEYVGNRDGITKTRVKKITKQ